MKINLKCLSKIIELLSPWVIIGIIAIYRRIEHCGKMTTEGWALIAIIGVLVISTLAKGLRDV